MIMSPDVHAHQLADGSLLVGEIFSGGAPSQMLCDDPDGFARDILGRLERRVPALHGLILAQCRIGQRPVPADGFPAIGAIPALGNVYAAVMHSGVTLAGLVGQLAAQELVDGANCPQLSDFRPSRFGETPDSMS
jgi:glycine/D-amino acid oxidase-like deaminating enzyme